MGSSSIIAALSTLRQITIGLRFPFEAEFHDGIFSSEAFQVRLVADHVLCAANLNDVPFERASGFLLDKRNLAAVQLVNPADLLAEPAWRLNSLRVVISQAQVAL